MRAVSLVVRLVYRPRMATAERARRRLAEPKKQSGPPAGLRKRHDVRSRQVGGFPCHSVTPRGRTADRAAVYLHGGAYVSEISPQHWTLVSRLADAGVRVEVPSYGLAPEHTYREAYPFVTAVYRELLTEVEASTVTILGDSAGGGLALGLAQTLAGSGLPQPRGATVWQRKPATSRLRTSCRFPSAAGGSELPLAAAIRARARSTVAIRGL